MSTELKTNNNHPMSLTRYWGGQEQMVQVTGPNCDKRIGYIGLSRSEAIALADDLVKFANKNEEDAE